MTTPNENGQGDSALREEVVSVLKALTGSLGTFSLGIPQDEQFWTTSDSEALEAGRELLAKLTD
jgi:hypothetical protein